MLKIIANIEDSLLNVYDFNFLDEMDLIDPKEKIVCVPLSFIPDIFSRLNDFTQIMIMKYLGSTKNALIFTIEPQPVFALCLDSICEISVNDEKKKISGMKNIKFSEPLVVSFVDRALYSGDITLYLSKIVPEGGLNPCKYNDDTIDEDLSNELPKSSIIEKEEEEEKVQNTSSGSGLLFPEIWGETRPSITLNDVVLYINTLNKKFIDINRIVLIQEHCNYGRGGTRTFDLRDIMANTKGFLPIIKDNAAMLDILMLQRYRIETELNLETTYVPMCQNLLSNISADHLADIYSKLVSIEKNIELFSNSVKTFAHKLADNNKNGIIN